MHGNTIVLLSFTVLPLVLGLAWPGRFRWLAAIGFGQAVVLRVWSGYLDTLEDGDWSSRSELAVFVGRLYLGVLFPVWVACRSRMVASSLDSLGLDEKEGGNVGLASDPSRVSHAGSRGTTRVSAIGERGVYGR